jgi:class 3 adenylate cyclase/tetratricopeptide (TPR) repeat protein
MNCATCGFSNPAEARFCAGCGTAILKPQRSDAPAERRIITVIFCDLVESTALSELIDPEEFRDLLNDYQNTCARAVKTFDGYLAHLIGDGVVIYFGYPKAHEDDEVRAVRCSLAIQEAVEELNKLSIHQVQARIGIHRGRVVVGALGETAGLQPMAVGETPNIAARLQAEASPGEIVVSDSLWRLVSRSFDGEQIGSRRLKGIRRPIEIHRIVEYKPAKPNRLLTSPFIGRQEELAVIDNRWQLVLEGEPQTIVLLGEPGIGKSRLIEQTVIQFNDADPVVLKARCDAYSSDSPYMPLIEMMRSRLSLNGLSPSEQLSELATRLSALGLDQPEALPLLAQFLSIEIEAEENEAFNEMSALRQRQRTQELIVEALKRLASDSPLLLIIEDLHWVDASTLELLNRINMLESGNRVMLLMSTRQELDIAWTADDKLTRIILSQLVSDESEAIILAVASDKPLPYALVRQIGLRASGNPLFLEEITLSVLGSEYLTERESTWDLLQPFSAELVPNTMEAALMARLDKLGESKTLLQIGSTLGREFRLDLLCAVAPLSRQQIEQTLQRMVKEGFLTVSDAAEKSYIFKHALMQDVAYQSLLLSTRQQYHARIADVLSIDYKQLGAQRPDLLAHHLSGAHRYLEAAKMWLTAGTSAMQRTAVIEAVDHLNRGLRDLAKLEQDEECWHLDFSISMSLAPAQMAVLGWASPVVEKTCLRAITMAERLGFDDQRFAPLWGLWSNQFVAGRLLGARDAAELLLVQAERSNQTVHLIAARNAASYTYFYRGDYARAIEHADAGLALYDQALERELCLILQSAPTVHILSARANALWMLGKQLEAEHGMERMIELARSLSHPPSLAAALAYKCFFFNYSSDYDRILKASQELLALSIREGYALWHAVADLYKTAALLSLNPDNGKANAVLTQVQVMRQTGAMVTDPSTSVLSAKALRHTNRLEDALAECDQALNTARRGDVKVMVPDVYRMKGDVLADLGRAEEADHAYCKAVEHAREQEAVPLELRALIALLNHRQLNYGSLESKADLQLLVEHSAMDPASQEMVTARWLLSALN